MSDDKLAALTARRDELNKKIARLASEQKRAAKKQQDRTKVLLGVAASMLARDHPEFRRLLQNYIDKLGEKDKEWLHGEASKVLADMLGDSK